jgi:hypothetical protein
MYLSSYTLYVQCCYMLYTILSVLLVSWLAAVSSAMPSTAAASGALVTVARACSGICIENLVALYACRLAWTQIRLYYSNSLQLDREGRWSVDHYCCVAAANRNERVFSADHIRFHSRIKPSSSALLRAAQVYVERCSEQPCTAEQSPSHSGGCWLAPESLPALHCSCCHSWQRTSERGRAAVVRTNAPFSTASAAYSSSHAR